MVDKKTEKYIEGIGRRKTASARVRIYPGSKSETFKINGKDLKDYFSTSKQEKTALAPFELLEEKFKVTVQIEGGGSNAQAEAVRHGLSRALVKHNEKWRKELKERGFLTRDPRMKESKKPGLKGARRAKQWRKR
jgi:small subunit ribosomal protein S9